MPETPINLRVPPVCPECSFTGKVQLQQINEQGRVLMEWACKNCGHTWLVRHKDETPRTA